MPVHRELKIALIGDIHANLPALEAVLSHARFQGATQIWNIGDFVGYAAFPEEVVRLLQQEGATSIAGNYDRKVIKFPRRREKWRQNKHPLKWLAFGWAYEHLSPESRKYLAALPDELLLEESGKVILLTHGSPASNEESLTPSTPDERLEELIRLAEKKHQARLDAIVCGHSHQVFVRQVRGTWFINTGSVGRPDDGDPRAAYAILNLAGDLVQVEQFRVAYDFERAAQAIRASGLPEAFAQMHLRGCDLETVEQQLGHSLTK